MKFGAIDIGTNAARLLIGEVVKNDDNKSFIKKISYTRVPLRLGLEVFKNGEISHKKIKEFTKTIQAFKLIAEVFDVKDLRACATSAMREADNGLKIKAHILEETGVDIEVIDGAEEAKLIFSTFALLDLEKDKPFVVVDVGGGSTEINIFKNGKIVSAKSFKIGTIRILKDKVKDKTWKELDEWLTKKQEEIVGLRVFATGGNINKTHKLLGFKFLEPLPFRDLEALYDELKELSLDKRIEQFGLKEDRADVIVPALHIYLKIMRKLKAKEVIVPKVGLSDGVILELAKSEKNKI